MRRIVLATGNTGKLAELQALLTGLDIELRAQSEFDIEGAEETGLTFVENAILKARHTARLTALPAIADDSGLEVDALEGAPGIHSARYAGTHGDDNANNRKLLHELNEYGPGERTARFRCAAVFLRHAADPAPVICQGMWEGRILTEPRGNNGFGYDPLFFDPEDGCSAAELPDARKNQLSHRARALQELAQTLKQQARTGG